MCKRVWAVILPWLALVGWLAYVGDVWSSLPETIAVHFGMDSYPDQWAPKVIFVIVLTVLWIGSGGWIGILICRRAQRSVLLMLIYFLIMTVTTVAAFATIHTNLSGRTPHLSPYLLFSVLLPFLLLLGAYSLHSTSRFKHLSLEGHSSVIGVERHASGVQGLFLLALACMLVVLGLAASRTQVVMWVAAMTCGSLAIAVFSGFRYRFESTGLQIKCLGVELMSVSSRAIKTATSIECAPLRDFGGWGIRHLKDGRAYILGGNRAVLIELEQGSLYLGTNDPSKVIQLIETMKARTGE